MSKLNTLLAHAAGRGVILMCALVAPIMVMAQTPPPTTTPTPEKRAAPRPAAAATGEPDLSITANVTARELLFEVVPAPKVEFPGRPRRDTVWEAERTNLPAQVQPGVTYRDIGIRLKITSVFADIERIVAEALGEIPAGDDAAPPKTNPNEDARPPAADAPPPTKDGAQTVAAAAAAVAPPPASTTRAPSATPARAATRKRVRGGGDDGARARPGRTL